MAPDVEVLRAPHVLEYTYTRSTGPVVGAFLAGLRDGKVFGVRGSDGRVLVPAVDYDPLTAEDLDELVAVGTEGVVTTWAWNETPLLQQPFEDRPFAWALVLLDGADTALLGAVDVASADQISTGARVRVRWRDERVGAITDIACFEVVGT